MTLKDKMDGISRENGMALKGFDLFVLRGKTENGGFDMSYLANEECADAAEFPFYSNWNCHVVRTMKEAVRATMNLPRLICVAAPLPTIEFRNKWRGKPWQEIPSKELELYALFNRVYPIVYPEGTFSCFTYPNEKEYYPVLSGNGDLWAYCANPFHPNTPLPEGFSFLHGTDTP